MRAWILEKQAKIEERPLRLVEVPTPHAKDGEIRIKINVCGVCRTDIHIAEGDLSLRKSPLILGHEIVGIVDEVGNDDAALLHLLRKPLLQPLWQKLSGQEFNQSVRVRLKPQCPLVSNPDMSSILLF